MMGTCDCHACELGDPAMCYGCPTHGAWCDWFGEGPKCVPAVVAVEGTPTVTDDELRAAWIAGELVVTDCECQDDAGVSVLKQGEQP